MVAEIRSATSRVAWPISGKGKMAEIRLAISRVLDSDIHWSLKELVPEFPLEVCNFFIETEIRSEMWSNFRRVRSNLLKCTPLQVKI